MTDLINYLADFGFVLGIVCIMFIPIAITIWLMETYMPQSWIDKIVAWMSESEE